jgi:membrane associated rhomboid family serine protease
MRKVLSDYKLLLIYIVILWSVEIVNLLLNHSLNQFALRPREVSNLYGVISMHFLHNGVGHLLSNTIPLLILGFFISALNKLPGVTFLIMLLTGLLVWLFARDGLHVGASGLVMGYWGYLISNAYFNRSFKNIAIAVITLLIYSGAVFTLFDFRAGISFEGHIFGFISGVFCAWLWAQRKPRAMRKTVRGR